MTDQLSAKIGDFIHRARSQRGLTQVELADRLQMSRSGLTYRLQQPERMRFDVVARLLAVLDLTWHDLADHLEPPSTLLPEAPHDHGKLATRVDHLEDSIRDLTDRLDRYRLEKKCLGDETNEAE